MTLLTIMGDACRECKIPAPTAIIGNTDRQISSLLAMANRSGRTLAKENEWTILQRLHTITTVASQEEYDLPSDFSRVLPSTEWDRTKSDPMTGPASPQQWQEIKSGLVGQSIVNRRYRIYRASSGTGRKIYIDPVPSASGETLVFEYISNGWCSASDGTPQSAWAADDDEAILDSDLLTLDLICRWKRANGLDFASEADELVGLFGVETAKDRPAKVLNLTGAGGFRVLDSSNLPETGLG